MAYAASLETVRAPDPEVSRGRERARVQPAGKSMENIGKSTWRGKRLFKGIGKQNLKEKTIIFLITPICYLPTGVGSTSERGTLSTALARLVSNTYVTESD